uniref:Organic cation transporter protein-like n=1 Tax=Hirondellea gigas TaxID=1518452 RepID=A0A6A7FPC7_9CRUS
MRNASIPWEEGSDGVARYSRCRYYVRDYEEVISLLPADPSAPVLAPPLDTNTTTCSSWHYDRSLYTNTVVSEWNLVCEDRWLMSSAQASYMAGFMVGALVLSELADKYGRRTLLLWSTLLFTVTTIATYFSTSYLMFITFRFFVAAFGSGVFLSNYVILMESLGLHSRTLFGVLYHIFFTTGICILALLGYLYRDWRDLQLASSLPTILLLSYYFLTPESPRWLMMEGRHEEALVILRRMAKFNRGSLPQQQQLQLYIDVIDRERHKKYAPSSFKEKCFWFMQSQLTLVRTPNMRRRCLITFFAWFVISMIYYGLAFNGGNLNLPPYVLMTTNGVVEFVACFSTIWILNVCGRRLSLCILLVVCGVACLVIVFIPVELSWVNMVLSSVGRFFIAPGFTVVFMYSVELVPTHVRNVAIGTSSMCARIGSGIAPYIVDLLGAVHYAVPSTVFGGFAVTAGLLSLLLPETGKQRLPESIKEIEAMPR